MANAWSKNPRRLPAPTRLKIGMAMLELRDKADQESAEVSKQLEKAAGTLAVPGGATVEAGKEIKTGGPIQGGVLNGTKLYQLDAAGQVVDSGRSFNKDVHVKFDTEVTLVGNKYYSLKIGADTFYVLKTQVTPAAHEAVQGWLFPHPPTVDDVTQGGLGDCYLIAALQAVVAKNSADITGMMRDEGNTVTVRFYDVNEGPPKTYAPKYISIRKSVMKSVGNQLYATGAGGALWVPMLEKAYAAAGYQGMKTDATGASAQARTYADIAGGVASTAWEHLVGKPFKAVEFKMESGQSALASNAGAAKAGFSRLPWSDEELNAYRDARAGFLNTLKRIFGQKAKLYASLASFQILKDADQVDTWIDFVKANKPIDDAVKAIALGPTPPAGYTASVRIGDFNKLFTSKGLDAKIGNKIIAWLTQYRLYPGNVGSGVYTSTQTAFFQRVRKDLAGGYVALSSNKLVGTKSAGPGKSAGEQKSKGLVGGHAYTVLKAKPDLDEDKIKPTERRFLTLRNPWGEYGRKYKEIGGGEMEAEEDKTTAIFDLELSEVTERFWRIAEKE